MREFNTSGPCNPTLHYTVMREALIAKGKEKVNKGRYITLFAPRQSGRTTYIQLLLDTLKDDYLPVWIRFERKIDATSEEFYAALNEHLYQELTPYGIQPKELITSHLSFEYFFAKRHLKTKPIVLVVDELEGFPDAVLSDMLHTFRKMYHQKDYHVLHSLILVGMSNIIQLVITAATFNIADDLEIPYLTADEVRNLIGQYVAESGQPFDEEVIAAIIHNTNGQPHLVSALCHHLVTEIVTDRSQPVTMDAWYPTLNDILTPNGDKNIATIVEKAQQSKQLTLKALFNDPPITFNIYHSDIAWLHAEGVIDSIDGRIGIAVPLYAKRLVRAFAPVISGESEHYLTSPQETFSQYVHPEGRLNVNALLQAYHAYVRRRGYQAFDIENLDMAAYYYSLDAFISCFAQQIGGKISVKIPSGPGQIGLLLQYQSHSYIINTTVFPFMMALERGKGQLAAYLQSERLDAGYYVVFSALHTDDDTLETEEVIDGKRIYTHIILTNFERPSKIGVRE